jgi:flavodoxin
MRMHGKVEVRYMESSRVQSVCTGVLAAILAVVLACMFMVPTAAFAKTDTGASSRVQIKHAKTAKKKVNKKVLVVYFSATGNTKRVAKIIANTTNGRLYRIKARNKYTSSDIDYSRANCRAEREQSDSSARPAIKGKLTGLKKVKTVYLGFPIWYGDAPRVVSTFLEKHSMKGKRVIPFCTSASSGISRASKNLKAVSKSGRWKKGKRFGEYASKAAVKRWVKKVS